MGSTTQLTPYFPDYPRLIEKVTQSSSIENRDAKRVEVKSEFEPETVCCQPNLLTTKPNRTVGPVIAELSSLL